MKKMMLWLCLMMIVPTLASADMVSISELRQQVEVMGRWTQTYEAHGRTIEVDVPIIVPEVISVLPNVLFISFLLSYSSRKASHFLI